MKQHFQPLPDNRLLKKALMTDNGRHSACQGLFSKLLMVTALDVCDRAARVSKRYRTQISVLNAP